MARHDCGVKPKQWYSHRHDEPTVTARPQFIFLTCLTRSAKFWTPIDRFAILDIELSAGEEAIGRM